MEKFDVSGLDLDVVDWKRLLDENNAMSILLQLVDQNFKPQPFWDLRVIVWRQ